MRPVRFLSLALAFTLVVAACGDDDDDDGGTGTAAGGGDTTESAAGDGGDEFCTAYLDADETVQAALDEGGEEGGEEAEGEEPTDTTAATTTSVAGRAQTTSTTAPAGGGAEVPPEVEDALTALQDSAPEEIQEDVVALSDLVREAFADPSILESPEFSETLETVDAAAADQCADATSDVTGTEYAFQGFEPEVTAGVVAFNFTNEGEELHEMALFRINDDVDLSVEEMLQLPEDEAETMFTEAGGAFAFPGDSDTEVLELEAGRYGMVCFIPVGTTPDVIESGQEPAGAPHFTEGMFGEFTVS